MWRKGSKELTVIKAMQKYPWVVFIKKVVFDTGEFNLVYRDNDNTICFWFNKTGRLEAWV